MLKGDRVILRAMRREDLERFTEFRNDVEFDLLAGWLPAPVTTEQVEREYAARTALGPNELVWFAIEAHSRFIGQCHLRGFDHAARHAELGISIGDRDFWGRGYGRDAVRILVKYAFRLRNLERVWLTVHASNERAIRAFQGAGFVEEGRLRRHIWLDGRPDDLVYMGILRDEWQRPPGQGEEMSDATDGA